MKRTQNPPGTTPCEFDSHLGHSTGSSQYIAPCLRKARSSLFTWSRGARARATLDGDVARALHRLGQRLRGGRDRQNPVGVAVHDEGRDVDLRDDLPEVGVSRSRATPWRRLAERLESVTVPGRSQRVRPYPRSLSCRSERIRRVVQRPRSRGRREGMAIPPRSSRRKSFGRC